MDEVEILRAALSWRRAGRQVAVCTVVETKGSAPKPVGSHLVVDDEGAFLGSVSAGCVEGDVIMQAVEVTETGRPHLLSFGVADDVAWKAGLTCGGEMKVYVERLDEELEACLSRVTGDRAIAKATVLITPLDGASPEIVELDERADHPLAAHLEEVVRTGKSRLIVYDGRQRLLTAFIPPGRLVVIGAVHIAQALTRIADLANLQMTVIDPRSAFATEDRFPNTRLIVDWPSDVAGDVRFTPSDAVVVLSHDPKIDDPSLRLALEAGCFYVGALGSRKSHARRLERLRSAGVGAADLRHIRGPIGLDIGAEGSTEIAIAIIAEIVAARRAAEQTAATLRAV